MHDDENLMETGLDTLEVEADEEEPQAADDTETDVEAEGVPSDRSLTDLFFEEVCRFPLLTREQEDTLGRAIARARERVRRLLRGQRETVERALAHAGRGVVHPDEDFREREALLVLDYLRSSHEPKRGRGQGCAKNRRSVLRELEQELASYRVLRDQMMTANIRLVMSLARRYRHPTLSYLDLVQEGMLGLMRAVEKFEPARGIKFSTYAAWWIWQQMSRAADCQGAMIRTPVHWNQFRRRIGRTANTGGDEEDSNESYGVPSARAQAMSQSFQCLSLAAPLADGDERTLGDTLATDAVEQPEGAVLDADLTRRLAVAVDELPAREAEILRMRFGLDGSEPVTLEDIGVRFGVSRERIRQLEARALKRMRAICDQRGLAEFLN